MFDEKDYDDLIMIKIAHAADIHIKNLKYHWEYNQIFEKMYQHLRDEEVDYIYIGGDIAHTKTQISPEFVDMCSKFLSTLADIAPTVVILGNHDGNLKNSSRQDAITPIVEALEHPNLHLLKDSGEFTLDNKVVFNVLSVFDEDNWVNPSDDEKINIALYHGSVSGVQTDAGWVMDYGDHDVSIFAGHDYAMLGDIHKTNQILDEDGRVRYSGSIVQQNHGETNDKGFLIWEIENKNDFTVRHVELKNPKPFITIELTRKGRMPRGATVPPGARLRLVSNNNLPLEAMRRAVEVAKHRFAPESISFLNRAAGERGTVEGASTNLIKENLRDVSVQEKFIREYLKDYEASEEVMEKVLELNRKYNTMAEAGEEISRNVNWKLKSFKWDNLFNYGESNKVNFEKLNGIVGIFGKNYSGKSSVIDSLLYTMFNSTSKNERKNLNIINQNKDYGHGTVEIEIGDRCYTIDRRSEKYIKKLKGQETTEAKTDLDFSSYNKVLEESCSQNGLTRMETDKKIRKVFGSLDDFLLTSMASQLDSLSFIKEGSTKRKEILAKFLDLEIFEKKFKFAKEDASDLRGALKRLSDKEYDEGIERSEEELRLNEKSLKKQQDICTNLKANIENKESQIVQLEDKIASIPAEVIDFLTVSNQSEDKQSQKALLQEKIEENKKKILDCESTLTYINEFLSDFDVDNLSNKEREVEEQRQQLAEIVQKARDEEKDINNKKNKLALLDEVPCGNEYPMCKFIRDAHRAKKAIPTLQDGLNKTLVRARTTKEKIDILNPDGISDMRSTYSDVLFHKNELENRIKDYTLFMERTNTDILSLSSEIEALNLKIKEYEDNREVIENLETLAAEKKTLNRELEDHRTDLAQCDVEVMELYKLHGSLEQRLQNLKLQKAELQTLREEFSAHDLYMRCMHSNGIAYDIIKKQLPAINNEIAKVLANIVNFEIFFEDDGRRLNIFIKHPSHDARPLEMGSGAEKTIASMAIRLALLSVSSLPKGDIFILDEPGTALDEDNMEGFVRILELVKSYFKTVLLISHLDSLKDCVDTQITIEKTNGYAHVNF